MAHKWAGWLHNPCRLGGGGGASNPGTKSKMAHKWAGWLQHPYRLGGPNRFTAGGGGGPEMAQKWAVWLHNPCRLGGPQRFTAGDTIRNGPQVSRLAV